MSEPTYPVIGEKRYVRDRNGVVWLLLDYYDFQMATTADLNYQYSCGINWLRNNAGPLEDV